MNSIGIGITTTSNRKAIFERSILQIRHFAPVDAKIVTITDTVGIAKAKNQCLALLDDKEHIFLFDDDTYPIAADWHLPYIESGEPHLSYTFKRKIIRKEKGLIHYELPSGCMIYINRKCLETVGGFDERFEGYSYEHVNYSMRVHNAGLTTSPFMDVIGSDELIYSMDEHERIQSSVPPLVRVKGIRENRVLLGQNWDSKEFRGYK